MNKILVTYATKYGATQGIAEKIGAVLKEKGLEVDVFNVKQVKTIEPYQAVVFGSAAYIMQWRREAVTFVRKHQKELSSKAVWIFSSGPMEDGNPVEALKGWLYPKSLKEIIENIQPKDITIFHGMLQKEKLNTIHRWMMEKFPVEKSDYRDWDMIQTWAETIAESLAEKV